MHFAMMLEKKRAASKFVKPGEKKLPLPGLYFLCFLSNTLALLMYLQQPLLFVFDWTTAVLLFH